MDDRGCKFQTAIDLPYDDDDSDISEGGWISWFCSLQGHEFLAQMDEEFVRDPFNLYGIRGKFSNFQQVLSMVLLNEKPDRQQIRDQKFLDLYQQAVDLYGLIHARYILSPRGLAIMREKHLSGVFGVCPRVYCQRSNVVPVGVSDELRNSRVKVFCPRCQEIYIPRHKNADIDGAYFGTSFPHIFLQSYPDLVPKTSQKQYIPKIYGFKIVSQRGSTFRPQANNEIKHSQNNKSRGQVSEMFCRLNTFRKAEQRPKNGEKAIKVKKRKKIRRSVKRPNIIRKPHPAKEVHQNLHIKGHFSLNHSALIKNPPISNIKSPIKGENTHKLGQNSHFFQVRQAIKKCY